jgi:hypothetical protein
VIKKERKERIQILKKPKVAEGFGSGESVYKKMIDRIVRVTVFHRPGMLHTHQCQVDLGCLSFLKTCQVGFTSSKI